MLFHGDSHLTDSFCIYQLELLCKVVVPCTCIDLFSHLFMSVLVGLGGWVIIQVCNYSVCGSDCCPLAGGNSLWLASVPFHHVPMSWGCFLTLWHHKNAPGSSWFFHGPALESALFPRSLGPFSSSRASSQPSDWICISCVSYIAGPFLTHWAIRETQSSMLVWEISWTEEPGRLHSMGLQRGGHDWATKH